MTNLDPGVTIVVGGQFGSEGKGALIAWLAEQQTHSFTVVRTGGPNAGHSMKHNGKVYKMRQIPCAWHNPRATLALGPGAVLDLAVLAREIREIEAVMGKHYLAGRLYIDYSAVVITDEDREAERALVREIGSTGEGVGAAQAQRVRRKAALAGDTEELNPYLRNVPELLREVYQRQPILVESTQGFGLSLTRSYEYPYVTSRDLTPSAIMNEAGIPHNWDINVIAVFRTYPIRVWGPSGPMRGGEISWSELSRRTNGYIQEERTTVTDKVRRVSEWDSDLAKAACQALQPDWVHLSFYDYVYPECANKTPEQMHVSGFSGLQKYQNDFNAPIRWVGTGFQVITDLQNRKQIW